MGFRARGPARQPSPPADDEKPSAAARILTRVIERGSRVQQPAVRKYLTRLRDADPGAGPADIVQKLERRYLTAVMVGGALVGALAAVPAVGTLLAFWMIAGETAVFLEATTLFVLALAEVHSIPAEGREQRRALVLAVLVGNEGRRAVADLLGPGRTGGAWLAGTPGGALALPLPAASELNSRLLRYFVKRYTLRRGALAFGKLLPAGLGAIVGAIGNRLMGKKIIANARNAFGVPPARWPVTLHLLPSLPRDDTGPETMAVGSEVAGELPLKR